MHSSYPLYPPGDALPVPGYPARTLGHRKTPVAGHHFKNHQSMIPQRHEQESVGGGGGGAGPGG